MNAIPALADNVLLNDPFTDGSRTNTTGGDTLGGVWFKNNGTIAVVDDSAGIGSGNALSFTPSADTQNLRAFFSSASLVNAGDTIRVQVSLRFTSTPPNLDSGFKLGLYNSAGTKITADNSVGTTANDDKGYGVSTNAGAASGTGKTFVYSEDAGNDILGGSAPGGVTNITTTPNLGGSAAMGTTTHTMMLQMTRMSDGNLLVTGQIDNLRTATAATTTVLTYAFDQIAIGVTGLNNHQPFMLDNVVVQTFAIPTVSVIASVSTATEGGASGKFAFTRDNGAGAVSVNYTVGGTAVSGLDYPALSGTVSFADGETSKDVIVAPVADYYADPSDTVIVTLAANANYFIGAASTATITITDATSTPVEYFSKTGITSSYNIANSSSGFYTKSFVSVSGQSFTQAMHVVTTAGVVSPYDGGYGPQIWSNLAPAIAVNDLIVGTFWARSLNADGSHAWAGVKIADVSDTLTAGFGDIAPGPNWQKYTVFYQSGVAFAAGTARLKFFVGYGPMTLEVGGISLLNYGQVSPDSLGIPLYDGQQANASWRTAAAARIEQYRKANFNVTVRDAAGYALPGASVRAKMKRHAFGFGTAINSGTLFADGANYQTYRNKVKQLFNWAVGEGAWKWKSYEPNPTSAVNTLAWLNNNGIARVRGHNLIWPSWGSMPADVQTTYSSTLASSGATAAADWMRSRILNHITPETSAFAGKMACWDVLNEPFSNHDAMDVLGRAEMAAWFNAAKAADPGTQMFLNQDYNIMGDGMPQIYSTINTINEIRANAGTVDGIGLESHLGLTDMTGIDRVKEVLDMWAAMGLRIQVTEFDLDSSVGQQCQADFLRDYMTVCFSHPGVDAFLQWGFWAGAHWKPDRALYNTDWSIRPNGQAFLDQVFTQWWTDTTTTTDGSGQTTIRGFKGDYDLIVTAGSTSLTVPASSANGDVTITITPRTPVTTTLSATADAYVQDGASASTNFGTSAVLSAKTSTSAGLNRDGYVKFSVPALTPIASAKLRVRAALSAAQAYGISMSALALSDTSWTESGINWNNKPAGGATLANVEITSTTPQLFDLDVTSYLQAEQAAGHSVAAFVLHNAIATSGPLIQVDSRETANGPQLVIISAPPEAHLAALGITNATLTPAFSGTTTAYTATVANNTASLTLTPSLMDLSSAIKINGNAIASGTTTAPLSLAVGVNTITVLVTAADGTTTLPYTLTITRQSVVQDWQQQYFGTTANTGNTADDADYDKDGVPNLVEWALGLNPTTASQLPAVPLVSGSTVTYTYTRMVASVNAGAVFSVQWSDTLAGNSWSSAGVTQQVLSDNGVSQQVRATLPAGSNGRRFVRLSVTAPP